MRKDLKKNKKGFTLVEIIVVLLIIGILLAITIPSIMGYVSQAKDAQYEAEARSGYVAAQTIVAKEVAKGINEDSDPKLSTYVDANSIGKELGESDGTEAGTTIEVAKCAFDTTDKKTITKCAFVPKSNNKKVVIFDADKDSDEPTVTKTADEAITSTSIDSYLTAE